MRVAVTCACIFTCDYFADSLTFFLRFFFVCSLWPDYTLRTKLHGFFFCLSVCCFIFYLCVCVYI